MGNNFAETEQDIFIKKISFIADSFETQVNLKANWTHNPKEPRGFHTFLYVRSGEAMLCPGDNKFHVKPNDIVLIPGDVQYHSYGIKPPFYNIIVCFYGEFKNIEINNIIKDENKYFLKIFEEINKTWSIKKYGYLLQVKSLIYDLAREIIVKNKTVELPEYKYEFMNKANEYIEKNMTSTQFSVNELVRYSGVSDTYFRSVFKEIYGTNPVKHINNLRIQKAKDYLKGTGIQICKIAEMVGFENVYYFSNVFKSLVGQSPLQYRNSHKRLLP